MNTRNHGLVLEETQDNFLVFRNRILLLIMLNDGSVDARETAKRKLREIAAGSERARSNHKKNKPK